MFIGFSKKSSVRKQSFIYFGDKDEKIYINLKIPTFGPVDGRCMVPNKGVYLGNHCIDESKILQNLVYDM